ncbi:hypothetical protein [Bifidobacterium saguinibicoloris]|uniref:hypothetical protein n=1 Tax=Bifidobacterium saguinibicoloris TaxID=2834433 RepID=UPI001C57A501|nr:hypothetical protein [Bifidobacterium saguinibicoloris]MBW3080605.1 hypothetical protein [Bifidobacterium saguinibicoloris]
MNNGTNGTIARNRGNGSHGHGRKRAVALAIAAVLALAIALVGCAGVDAHRWMTGRAPLFALRSSRAVEGGVRTDYRGLWYGASVVRFDDGNGYAHAGLGPGAVAEPPFDVRKAVDAVTDELERRGLADMSSRLDDGGYVTDCGSSTDDGGECVSERVGEDPRSFSRVRILDWTRDGDVVHAYVYAFGEEFYRSLEGDHIVMDSGGESTWTADLDVSDGATRLTALHEAGGVSSSEIRGADWTDLAQRMFLMMPHDGSDASSAPMRQGVEDDAKRHYQGTDGRIHHLIDGEFTPANG